MTALRRKRIFCSCEKPWVAKEVATNIIINVKILFIKISFTLFFLQFLNLDVFTLHPFVLEANADVVNGQDGMSAVRAPHVGVEEKFHECPCLIRVDIMLDLVSSDCLCCHSQYTKLVLRLRLPWYHILPLPGGYRNGPPHPSCDVWTTNVYCDFRGAY